MKQEDKDLLLKDLCARLPYGVKYDCSDIKNVWKLNSILTKRRDDGIFLDIYNPLDLCKPYLFPLSSMTEEQKVELEQIKNNEDAPYYHDINDFFLKYHLDNRHLIEKGLALDATRLNIY